MYYVIFELVFVFKAYVIDYLKNINFPLPIVTFWWKNINNIFELPLPKFCLKVIICHSKVTKMYVYFLNLFDFTLKLKRIGLNTYNLPFKFLK
jgi:hypothetical protein